MEVYDKKLIYYYNTKTLISFVISPLPFIFSAVYSILAFIRFIVTYTPQISWLPFLLGITNLWIASFAAYYVYNAAQKQYDMVHLSRHPSFVKPIVIPILWLIGTMVAWFLTLPVFYMYQRRY